MDFVPQLLLSFQTFSSSSEIMTRKNVSIGRNQERTEVEIGTRYIVVHVPVYSDEGRLYDRGQHGLPNFFPGVHAVEFYGILSEIEELALVFTDVDVPEQHRTGGSAYGIDSARYIYSQHFDRVRAETIDIARIVREVEKS